MPTKAIGDRQLYRLKSAGNSRSQPLGPYAMNPISIGLTGAGQQFLNSIRQNSQRQNTSLERLSTGKRINRPSDDPPGFIAAEELRKQLGDLQSKLGTIASQRDQNHIQQSGLANIENVLIDLRDQVLASADGFLSADEKAALQSQVNDTIDALNRIAKQTGNAGVVGLDSAAAKTLQSGDDSSAELLDAQTQSVESSQAQLAADDHAQLDTFQNLYQDQVAITSGALSQIEDTDFASETAEFTQSRVLLQSAMAAFSYASRSQADQIKQLLDTTA